MIEAMKKVSVLIKTVDRIPALNQLRKSGVLHISETGAKQSEEIERDEQLLHLIDRVLQGVPEKARKGQDYSIATFSESLDIESLSISEVLTFCREIDRLITQRKEHQDRINELKIMESQLEAWGYFLPSDLEFLHDNGITLTPVVIPVSEMEAIGKDFTYILLDQGKKQVRLVLVNAREDNIPDSAAMLKISRSLDGVRKEIIYAVDHILHIDERLKAEVPSFDLVRDVREIIASDYELKVVHENMESEGPVSWLTGFVPSDEVEAFRNIASQHQWGLVIEDPVEEDPVPTKLKNNWFVNMIKPMFGLLGTVPGYREYDVSTIFLIFLSVFVAMIIGDAGYGVIFLAVAVMVHIKTRKLSEIVRLIYVFSIMTILWGSVTGTWFSSRIIADLPFFRSLVIPQLSSFPELFHVSPQTVSETVMLICFVLAIIHLSLACIINLLKELPKLKAFTHLGWLSLLIGMFLLTLNLVLGKDFPSWGLYLIIGGIGALVVFGAQEEGVSFIKGVLMGLAGIFTTFLDSISAFSNIISYIRLFAVGMSSVAIASSFNNIAGSMPGGAAIVGAIFVLMLGHMLNIMMGLLSIVVHGVRLNMLEFSGQLGMEWSGTAYDPISEYKSRYFTDLYK